MSTVDTEWVKRQVEDSGGGRYFDEWLAEQRAEAWDAGHAAGVDDGPLEFPANPYRAAGVR